jgi:hypothetical protein
MSEVERTTGKDADGQTPADADAAAAPQQSSDGPSLAALYGLLALALIAAIGFAVLIVLPFYQRR